MSTVSQLVKMKLYRNQGFPLSAISLVGGLFGREHEMNQKKVKKIIKNNALQLMLVAGIILVS